MTNPLREYGSRSDGSEAPEVLAGPPPEPGSQASRHKIRSGTAGDGSQDAPRQFTAEEVLQLLVKAVSSVEAAGKIPMAAGVAARMRVIEPAFSMDQTEFSSFRQITQAAEAAGLVDASRGANDYVLKLRPRNEPVKFQGATLHPDLWRAIQDWTEGVSYAFDRTTHRTAPITDVVPEGTVQIPAVDRDQTIGWMREFAARRDGEQLTALNAALDEGDPVAAFHRVIRATDDLKRRWNRHLRRRVLDTAVAWASENAISLPDIFLPTHSATSPLSPVRVDAVESLEDEALRRRIIDVLGALPLHELLRLPIPLEYSLTR